MHPDDFALSWERLEAAAQRLDVDERMVRAVLDKQFLDPLDFAVLLSDCALGLLEELAVKAREKTRRHFGSSVLLFTPLYVSNYCENSCRYCSFACHHAIDRVHLAPQEIETAVRRIADTGMRHVLMLTGESRYHAGPDYLCEAVAVLGKFFSSVSIEIYPLQTDEYARLITEGVDGLTLYQEVYDPAAYQYFHPSGPKADYAYRLNAPDRACQAGMHAITLGALLGLADWRREALALSLHVRDLQRRFPAVELAASFPRMRPFVSDFPVPSPMDDKRYVQLLAAFRIFAPTVGITMSTRESVDMRDNCAQICVTKMSAGVSTSVGAVATGTPQFEISDTRDLTEVCNKLQHNGLQPVMHNWDGRFFGHPPTATSGNSL